MLNEMTTWTKHLAQHLHQFPSLLLFEASIKSMPLFVFSLPAQPSPDLAAGSAGGAWLQVPSVWRNRRE